MPLDLTVFIMCCASRDESSGQLHVSLLRLFCFLLLSYIKPKTHSVWAYFIQGVFATLSRMAKLCILRLTPDKLFFIFSETAGGVSIWCELSQVC